MDLITFIDYDLRDLKNRGMIALFLRSLKCNLPVSVDVTLVGNPKNDVSFLAQPYGFNYVEREALLDYHINVGWKLYNLCQWKMPFICIDCDTYVLSDLLPLVDAAKDKAWFCVPCYVDNAVAGGVQVCSDPDFLNWEEIMKFVDSPQKSESPTLRDFCSSTGYNPFHEGIDLHWNMVHWMAQRYHKENDRWRVISTLNKQVNIIHYVNWMRWKPNPIYDEHFNSHSG